MEECTLHAPAATTSLEIAIANLIAFAWPWGIRRREDAPFENRFAAKRSVFLSHEPRLGSIITNGGFSRAHAAGVMIDLSSKGADSRQKWI